MTPHSPAARMDRGNPFTHFMIRVFTKDDADPAHVSGTIERLGTGEKATFHDGAELLRLVAAWEARP